MKKEKLIKELGFFIRNHPMIIGIVVIMLLLITCTESRKVARKNKNAEPKPLVNGKTGPGREVADWSEIKVRDYINPENNESWTDEVERFYRERNYRLAWFEGQSLSSNALDFIGILDHSWKEGLRGNYYNSALINMHILKMNRHTERIGRSPGLAAQLDVLLTDSYISYASDLLSGRFNPASLDVVWETYPQRKNLVSNLNRALENNSIPKSLENLRPSKDKYKRLVAAYDSLIAEKLRGGWPNPGNFESIREGDTSYNVVKVKKYLVATGDLFNVDSVYVHSPVFDQRLAYAVERFQERHGIRRDGILGDNTLREMNKTLDYRIGQVKINLDRLRWMPEDLGNRYILVNIPDYSLKLFEEGRQIMQMKVIVGELENYTPILKDTISYIVFNPSWNVPYSIASEEMLPKIKRDTSYLAARNYILLRGSYASTDTVNPAEVKWDTIDKENFPFFIVQKPGRNNALGTVKFMMPNSHAIYLHDTPAGYLFDKSRRDFSHGCIRLERPYDLAEYLLEGQLEDEKIYDILSKEDKKTVILDNSITVHFIYHTAWVDTYGNLQFRNDVYDFDEKSIRLYEEEEKKDPLTMEFIKNEGSD